MSKFRGSYYEDYAAVDGQEWMIHPVGDSGLVAREVRKGGPILTFTSVASFFLDDVVSVKKGGGMGRARNVLTHPERMAVLQEDEKWTPEKGVYSLPKTKYRRLAPGQSGPKREEPKG